jgi:hypothetical protein
MSARIRKSVAGLYPVVNIGGVLFIVTYQGGTTGSPSRPLGWRGFCFPIHSFALEVICCRTL